MERSRNAATTALTRSANWAAIRALNSQRSPSIKKLPTNVRKLSHSFQKSLQHEEQRSADASGQPGLSARLSRTDGWLTLSFDSRKKLFPGSKNILKRTVIRQFDPKDAASDVSQLPVRKRLRIYERDVLGSPTEAEVPVVIGTSILPAQNGFKIGADPTETIEDSDFTEAFSMPSLDVDDLVDTGANRTFLLPGDLVELRLNSIKEELAIFIREIGNQSQFYTISGRWMNRPSKRVAFWVPHFVSSHEVDALLPYLPDKSVPRSQHNKLQRLENALPRDIGGQLIHKMRQYKLRADAIYRDNCEVFDNVHSILGSRTRSGRFTLLQAVERLFPDKYDAKNLSKHPETLYAVYRSIMDVDYGIFLPSYGNVRAWGRFEVLPLFIVHDIHKASRAVRLWQRQNEMMRIGSDLSNFVQRARLAVDKSRTNRPHTADGWVGPVSNGNAQLAPPNSSLFEMPRFEKNDKLFLRFILAWAAWGSFDPTSYLSSTGSAILRATGKYNDTVLDQATGWQFLQEIGFVKPWDIPTAFRLHLVGYRCTDAYRGLSTDIKPTIAGPDEISNPKFEAPDFMESLRQQWTGLKAYCIDDPSAYEIDDAVSISKATAEGEYWIHVHVADPASMLSHRAPAARIALRQMTNYYLPDRVVTMLSDGTVQDHLTLQSGRRCLTFSAKLNIEGEMVDYKVTPGYLDEVTYISPQTVAEICGVENEKPKDELLSVGDPNNKPSYDGASRHMSSADELQQQEKEDIRLLIKLGLARRLRGLLRGGTSFGLESLDVGVKIDRELVEARHGFFDCVHYFEDPYISLAIKSQNRDTDVAPLMILAAEVAAKWCKERNIPIIYRVTQKRPSDVDAAAYFKENILPHYLENKEPPMEAFREYFAHLGPVVPSSTPGAHVALGVEGFSRCTSPLRRFSDLITHWQIEAALRREAETGQSLVGSKDTTYLPFDKTTIDRIIHHQDEKESKAKIGSITAQKEYALQALLRAWKFGEGDKKLPETFKFRVVSVNPAGVFGAVEELGLTARMPVPEFVEDIDEVQEGEWWEAKIDRVVPYSKTLWLQGLRRLEGEKLGVHREIRCL